jgi:hypothetical protein
MPFKGGIKPDMSDHLPGGDLSGLRLRPGVPRGNLAGGFTVDAGAGKMINFVLLRSRKE